MSRQASTNARGLGLLLVLVVGLALFWRFSGGGRGARGAGVAGGSVEASREPAPVDEPAAPARVSPRDERALERDALEASGPGPGQLALQVTVRDMLDSRAIAGARVQALERVTEGAAPETRTTDELGACSLFVRDARASLRLRVEAAGYVHASWEIGRDQPIQLELQRATRLVGRVLDQANGAPVAGARLRFTHSNCNDCDPDEVVSGTDGRFVLPEVPRLDYAYLSVEAEGFVPLEEREFLLRTDATEVEQDVHLVRGVEVRGRVLDWSTRTGIAGARVGGLVADAEGRFAGRWQPEPGGSQVRVEVGAADHATLQTSVVLEGGAELEFVLPRLVTLTGRVLDASETPVAGAGVQVNGHGPARDAGGTAVETSPLYELPKGSLYDAPSWGVEADETGAFRFGVLPWCLNLELAAHAGGFLPASRTLRRVGEPGSEASADLVLEAELGGQTWLSGNVLLNGTWSRALTGSVRWRGPTRGGEARFESSRFELAVEPGEVALAFRLDAVPGELAGAELTVRARDGARVERQVVLRVREATITGRTRFDDGTPSPFVDVGALAEDGLVYSETRSDERGAFVLVVPDIGRSFSLEAQSYDMSVKQDDVAAGARGVELVFPRRYPLLVRFRDGESGAPLRLGAHVRLLARCGPEGFRDVEFEESPPDLDGWIEGWLAAPRVDLLAYTQRAELAAYGRRLVRDVALATADGRPARLELVLERVAPLVLELDERGEPLPEDLEALWLVEDELADGFPRSTSGRKDEHGLLSRRSVDFEDGRAVLAGYAPGRYRFLVDPPDIAIDPADVLVEPGGGLSVLVRWRRVR
jgi:carboxypeptidase family protein